MSVISNDIYESFAKYNPLLVKYCLLIYERLNYLIIINKSLQFTNRTI
jgi:hypothetical protein